MQEPHWVVSLLAAVIPFVVLIWAIGWHARQVRAALQTSDGQPLADAVAQLAAELRRANEQRASGVPMLR
jgi:hypothetical protein